jgi:hypothetical protein
MVRGGAKVFCIEGLVPCVATPTSVAEMSDGVCARALRLVAFCTDCLRI